MVAGVKNGNVVYVLFCSSANYSISRCLYMVSTGDVRRDSTC